MADVGAGPADPIEYARDLERLDAEIEAATRLIRDLADRVTSLRAQVASLAAALAALPVEREAAEHARARAAEEQRDARLLLDEATARVAQLEASRRRKQDELDQAQRELRRAHEELDDAVSREARADARLSQVDDDERALRAAEEGVVVEAHALATSLQGAPRVATLRAGPTGDTLAEIEEWAGGARAALVVARGVIDTERERLVLEANALGAAVLGESFGGASVASVRARIEAAAAATDS